MAQITMDASEWEAMKKVEKLLEKSIANEKKSSKKIDDLNQEIISTMKKNELNMTVISRTESRQILLCRKDPYLVIEELKRMFSRDNSQSSMSSGRYHGGFGDRDWSPHMDRDGHRVAEAIQHLFYTEEVKVLCGPDEVTYKGIGPIRDKIEAEFRETQSQEDRELLEDAKKAIKKYKVFQKKADEDAIIMEQHSSIISGLEADIKKLMKQKQLLIDSHKKDLAKIELNSVPASFAILTRSSLYHKHTGLFKDKKIVADLKALWEEV